MSTSSNGTDKTDPALDAAISAADEIQKLPIGEASEGEIADIIRRHYEPVIQDLCEQVGRAVQNHTAQYNRAVELEQANAALRAERDELRKRMCDWLESPEGGNYCASQQRDTANNALDRLEKELEKTEAENDQLQSDLAAARADTARIDWLENENCVSKIDGEAAAWHGVKSGRSYIGITVRDAIDAAMKEGQ